MGLSATFKNSLFQLPVAVCLLMSILVSGCQPKEAKTFDLKVESIRPESGPYTGGTELYIQGSGLKYIKSVDIGGLECLELSIVSDNTLKCTTQTSSIGEADVVLTNTIGSVQTTTFTFENTPLIDSITPDIGPLTGGTLITIAGSGFDLAATVSVGGTNCPISLIDSENISCTVAAHTAGVVNTIVTNPDGHKVSARIYAYRADPTVASVSPYGGDTAGGTLVTIDGTGFSVGASVTIGGSNCNAVKFISSTRITCVTTLSISGTGAKTITVTNTTGMNGTSPTAIFTYRAPPTITSLSDSTRFASITKVITINGTGFIASPLPSVVIGSVPCTVTAATATTITCTSGIGSDGTYDVVVTNDDQQTYTLPASFTLVSAPLVTSITPNDGYATGSTDVTIAGNYFKAGAAVSIGGSVCNISLQTTTQIKCTTTAHGAGAVGVIVTNTDTQVNNPPITFTYRTKPTITSVSPNSGASTGGTVVTVTGTGFVAGAKVTFNGSNCGGVSVTANGLSLSCTTSSHAAGGVSINVKNVDDQFGDSATPLFTYQDKPTVASVSPARGVPSGGTFITLTGTNFFSGIQVLVGTRPCTTINITDPTQLTCFTPTNAEGPTNITVMNTDLQTGSKNGAFNYQAVMLDWDLSPYDFGDSTTDLTRRFTLTNTGDSPSGTLTVSKTGTNTNAFTVTNNNCIAPIAAGGGTCTVDVTFPAAFLGENNYSANLFVTSSTGYNTTSALTGAKVDAVLAWSSSWYYHGRVATDDSLVMTLTNNGTDTTTPITITQYGSYPWLWSITGNTCSGSTLTAGATCTVTVTFLSGTYGLSYYLYDSNVDASADAGGTSSAILYGYGDL